MANLATVSAAKKFIYGSDPRSYRGMFARGKNVYNGGSHAAKVGPQSLQAAAKRRVKQNGR